MFSGKAIGLATPKLGSAWKCEKWGMRWRETLGKYNAIDSKAGEPALPTSR